MKTESMQLFRNIRFYILLTSVLFSIGAFLTVWVIYPSSITRITLLTEIYALTALFYLYISLLVGPLVRVFPTPFGGKLIVARRGLGVSAFYFAFLHACFAFFGQLGGFSGLSFLSGRYLFAILLSFTALIILSLMALTSTEKAIQFLTFPRWKFLHRFVYLAGILILIHAMLLGTHFSNLFSLVPQIVFTGLVVLLILEAICTDRLLQMRHPTLPRVGLITVITIAIMIGGFAYLFIPISSGSGGVSFGIHAAHIQLAKQAVQEQKTNILPTNLPGLSGDRTRRYTVSFLHADTVTPGQDTTLTFQVFNAANGAPVTLFTPLYTKVMHVIIVDNTLTYFAHIHPTQGDQGLSITTQFPRDGIYHLYLDFQPLGGIDQNFAFSLLVGSATTDSASTTVDTNLTKTFGDYEVSLEIPSPLLASEMTFGQQQLTYTIRDAKTKQPITDLYPYLGTFGHMTMINTKTYDFLHVHPYQLTLVPDGARGGPTVAFLPIGIYGSFKPGIYKVFTELNPHGTIITTTFTIEVK